MMKIDTKIIVSELALSLKKRATMDKLGYLMSPLCQFKITIARGYTGFFGDEGFQIINNRLQFDVSFLVSFVHPCPSLGIVDPLGSVFGAFAFTSLPELDKPYIFSLESSNSVSKPIECLLSLNPIEFLFGWKQLSLTVLDLNLSKIQSAIAAISLLEDISRSRVTRPE